MIEKFGVTPDKVVDVQALCGDSVDNVPGAPGIGIKTAAPLINEYGDLDTLLARAGEIKQDKRRETLIDFADQIRLSRELVQLDCDTPAARADRRPGGARARRRRSWRPSSSRWSSAPWRAGSATARRRGREAGPPPGRRAPMMRASRPAARRAHGADRHQRL